MSVIRAVNSQEIRTAIGVLLDQPNIGSGELHRQIDALLRYASQHHLSLDQCLVSETAGRIEAACLCVDSPGRASSVFIPNHLPDDRRADQVVELLKESVRRASGRRVRLLQALVTPEAQSEQALYRRAGFSHLTQLIYLERDVASPVSRVPAAPAVTWEAYAPRLHPEFARVVQSTYEGSLDCAALNGVRDIDDTLASHRATGEFDARNWLLARHGKEAWGAILMARIPERAALEVVYMGVVPYARKRGVGVALLRRAIEAARAQGCAVVTLTVDESNAPARRLYGLFGFQETSRRHVWMRVLDDREVADRGNSYVPF